MPSLKKITLILGLLSSFVTINADELRASDDKSIKTMDESRQKMGTSFPARVISAKAIVYADENMNSPLGFISNGKLITVGNPRKLNRELVPVVVYGRIGYIQIKDIRYEDDESEILSSKNGAPKEHDVDIILQSPDEKLSINNSAFFTFGQFFPAGELKELSLATGGEEKSTISSFAAQFIHRKEYSKFFWGAGFDYSFATTETLDFGYFLISPTFGYSLMRNPLFLAEVYGSFDFSVTTVMDIKNNFENESGGFVFGPQINARIVLFPEKKYHLVGGLGYRIYKVNELDSVTNANGATINGIKNLSGTQMFVGMGIEL